MQIVMKHLKIYFILFLFSAVQAYAQPVDSLSIIGTDSLPVQKLMYQPEIDTVSTWIRNLSKTDLLFYQASIEYKRIAKGLIVQDSLQLQAFENQAFNRYVNYVDSAFLSAAYGNPDKSSLRVATKFNADSAGFNLSNVGTWFIAEQDTSGIIQVEIRAGGSSIQDAIPVSQGVIRYEVSPNVLNGDFYNIELEKPVAMYPHEDFYVIFTYPAGISRPQGCAVNDALPVVEGRYWVEQNGQFEDLQQLEGYSNGAWLMYAAEKSPKDTGWLNFVSNPSDTIQANDSTLFYLQLNGLIAGLGSQYADIVIHSNDTINPVVKIPVHLRLNEAPFFLDVPSDLFVVETNVLTIQIQLEDLEKDTFSILPVMGCKFVQFFANDSVMTLKISPAKGDKGDYVVKYQAIDEYDAVRELKITIHVLENQAPFFIDPPAEIILEEGYSLEVRIEADDNEKDEFEISLMDAPGFVRSSFEYPAITLYFSPLVGDAGDYVVKLLLKDTIGSARELTIPVHILWKNRPPVCLNEKAVFSFSFMDGAAKFDINEYFTDLDDDSFLFEIFCHNSNVVDVSIDDESHFTLKPRSVGGTILDFTLTDARGEQAQYSLNVIVGMCEDPARIIVQKWNKVLLVNNGLGEYAPEGFQWYKNGQPIKNATLQYYSSEDDTGGLLEANAEYFVRIVKLNGDTIYTCPCTPVQNPVSLKAYPNPVLRGQHLNIESGSTNMDSGTIQVVDILGNTRKTVQVNKNNTSVQMPETPGFYIVKVVFDDREDVFRIKVK
ncbi:hypothetical protein AGMMS50239_25580 [Bacteroidia bacterium]|nr:hypothetical protein AGMMS50239_25580 [Bacteroidia bacterium]